MEQARRVQPKAWRRWEPLTGVGFIVLFVAGLVINNSPNPDESNATWHSYFADKGHQALVTIDGFLLVASGLCLLAFLSTIHQRIAARRGAAPSPLPIVVGGVAAAAIMIGGVAQAAVTGSMIFANLAEPGPDALRVAQAMGYPIIMVAGMFAASLSVAGLSIQAYSARILGGRLLTFGVVCAVGLLASVFFIPMVLLPIWVIAMTIVLMRGESDEAAAIEERLSAQLSGTPTRASDGAATPVGR
jgi:hypothetical protein